MSLVKKRVPGLSKMTVIVSFLCILFFTACNRKSAEALTKDSPEAKTVSEDIQVGYKTKICSNTNKDVCITFDTIMEESRCPIGLNCVWEGNAKGRFTLNNGSATFTFDLDTQPSYNMYHNDTTIGGYQITLDGLTPHPTTEYKIKTANYVASLVVKSINN